MKSSRNIVQGHIVGNESGEATISVPYGPWFMWRQPIHTWLKARESADAANFVLLCEFATHATPEIAGSADAFQISLAVNPSEGDSFIALPPEVQLSLHVPVAEGGGLDVALIPNARGHLAGLECHLRVATLEQAVALGKELVKGLQLYLTFAHHVPVFVPRMRIHSDDLQQRHTTMIAPTPIVPFKTPAPGSFHPSLVPYESLFSDGVRSESAFYRFLCFFNVLEQLIKVVNPRLKGLAGKHGVEFEPLKGSVPEDPFAKVAPKYVGRRLSKLEDLTRVPYRNAIAHLSRGSDGSLLSTSNEQEVREAAEVLGYACDELLQKARVNVARLVEADVKVTFGA